MREDEGVSEVDLEVEVLLEDEEQGEVLQVEWLVEVERDFTVADLLHR
jgi:hypothetical protein